MTLVSDIILAGYRESNYTAVGATPTAAEQAEALVLLQSLLGSVFPMIVGTKLKTWWLPWPQGTSSKRANYPATPGDSGILPPNDTKHPPANVRIMAKNTAAETVYFQYQPQDGALMEYVDVGHTGTLTLNANGALFGLTGGDDTVVITSDFPASRNPTRRWVYRADVGSWVEITTLVLTQDIPFPDWFDDYWVTSLALRLAPRFGNSPSEATLMRLKDMRVFIRGEYQQMGIEIVGTPVGRESIQSHDYDDGFGDGDFGTGFA